MIALAGFCAKIPHARLSMICHRYCRELHWEEIMCQLFEARHVDAPPFAEMLPYCGWTILIWR